MTLNVLLVDDDPLVLWTNRRCLEEMGCHVTDAATAGEAEEMCRANNFDLVVLDYRLSDGLGTDVLKKLRNTGHAVRAVCITGESESIPDRQRDELEIFEVLNKPVDMEMLGKTLARVAELCGRESSSGRSGGPGKPADGAKRIGRFELVKCPARLGPACLTQISRRYKATDWVALDLRNTRGMDDRAVPMLLRMAEEHGKKGSGRFCLAGISDKLWQDLEKLGLCRDVDMLRDIAGLDALGRRLTSISERLSVLDSVISRV